MRQFSATLGAWVIRALGVAAVVLWSAQSSAEQQKIQDRGDGFSWQAGVDGVEIEFNSDGSVRRIFSRYAHEVTIGDRRGIRTATVIAEEKAKANIVRFMEQQVKTGRVVTEVESVLTKTIQERTNDAKNVASVDTRVVGQNLSEVTASYASGALTGVVVLETGYDDKRQEAWVVVGMSEKSIRAATAVKKMTTPGPAEAAPAAPQPKAGPGGTGDFNQPSERRRSKQDF